MDLEAVGAVLELVGAANGARRQLAGLSHRRESGADAIGDHRSKNEAAALDADDEIDALILERQRETVDGRVKTIRILEERGDVVEENPGFRKIGNVPNLCFEVHFMWPRAEAARVIAR